MGKRFWISLLAGILVVATLGIWWFAQNPDPDAAYLRGLKAVESRNVSALHREIQILRRFPKFEPQVQLLRGTIFLVGNNLNAALQQFDLCSVHPATRVPALVLAGEVFCRLGRQGEALGVLTQALIFEPDNVDGHRWLAVAYYDTGASRQAVTELRKVAELAPNDYRPHRLMGLIHKDNEQFSEAVQDYRTTLRIAPDQPTREEVLLELGQSLVKLHRYSEALEFLNQAKMNADVAAVKAACEVSLGRKENARRAALEGIKLSPDHLDSLTWLGTLAFEAGDLKNSATYLEKAVKSHPTDFSAQFKLARVYQRLGRVAEADRLMVEVDKNRKLRESFADLHEKATQNPRDPEVRFQLGETARKLQLFELADMWYKAALGLNPRMTKAATALKELKGQQERATERRELQTTSDR